MPVINRLVNFCLSSCRVVLYRFYNHKHSDCCLSLNFLHFLILCLAMEQLTIAQRVLIVKTFYQNRERYAAIVRRLRTILECNEAPNEFNSSQTYEKFLGTAENQFHRTKSYTVTNHCNVLLRSIRTTTPRTPNVHCWNWFTEHVISLWTVDSFNASLCPRIVRSRLTVAAWLSPFLYNVFTVSIHCAIVNCSMAIHRMKKCKKFRLRQQSECLWI